MQAVGDTRAVAVTQSSLADVLRQLGRPQEALALYEAALRTKKAMGDTRAVAVTQANYGQFLLGQGEANRAVAMLWEAFVTLDCTGYASDAEAMRQILGAARSQTLGPEAFDRAWAAAVGQPQPEWLREAHAAATFTLPEEQRRMVVANTVAVLTRVPERRDEWRGVIAGALEQARGAGHDDLAALSEALLALLDGKPAELPPANSYRATLQEILDGIAAGGPAAAAPDPEHAEVMTAIQAFVNSQDWEEAQAVVEAQEDLLLTDRAAAIFEENIRDRRTRGRDQEADSLQQHLDLLRACRRDGIAAAFEQPASRPQPSLPFDEELIPRTVGALRGSSQDKVAHMSYLAGLAARTTDGALRALIGEIQMALVGGDLRALGGSLTGIYRQVWQAIVLAVAGVGLDEMLQIAVHNTLAVLGPAAGQRDEWRENLASLRNSATEAGDTGFVALINAISALLDAGGNPAGLGRGLSGPHAAAWKAILDGLSAR
jgi:tetratricopeptide (TPR) repeat protein